MPLNNYKCLNCGNSFEENVSIYNENVICPKCKSRNVLKKLPNSINSSSMKYPSSCG